MRNLAIERIAQHQLDGNLVACESGLFRLLRGDEQVDHLHTDGLSFSVLLKVPASGKHFDIPEEGLCFRSKTSAPAGRSG